MYNELNIHLTEPQFTKLRKFIKDKYGIKVPERKRKFLESRLRSRLLDLKLDNYTDYLQVLFSVKGVVELPRFEDVITTNKTDFFRENSHFEFVKNHIGHFSDRSLIKVWSAGCSSGEEPYTLAMVLNELKQSNLLSDFQIMATDVSEKVLKMADAGIYRNSDLIPVSDNYKVKYWKRGKGKAEGYSKIKNDLRKKVIFDKLNFLEKNYGVIEKHKFDMIFLRNVLIYFEKTEQELIINKLAKQLRPDGFLFIGHSESLIGLNVNFKQIKPAVFQKM